MDFRTDNNAFGLEFVKKALADKLPAYVTDDDQDMQKLASSAFADEANKEYPINSKSNTWKSIAYFYTQGQSKLASEKAKFIEKSLHLASIVHGIKEDAKNIVSVLAKNVKTASAAEREYAIEREGVKYLPIHTEEELIKSAKELDLNYLKLEPVCAKTAAVNIVKRANALGIASKEYIPAFILDKGTERLFNYEYAVKVAAERAAKTGCNVYLDLIESAKDNYLTNNDNLLKFASEFYKLDSAFGLDNYGDYGVQDPCDIFFNGINKQAADKFSSENVLFKDIFIPKQEFKSDSFKTKVQTYFSKKTASEILNACESDNTINIKIALDKLDEKIKLDLLQLLVK